jgi:LysR family transcriptional regulator, benzoate and cis,cis-muconate-responsive activator of ben and cat genes
MVDIRFQNAALILADELNFTRAAERLRITQPALSKQIFALEERLGFKVFERSQRQVNLTDAGEVFIGGCRDASAVLERAIRLARASRDEVPPVVTIGFSPYADPFLVACILGVQMPLYANLRLRIESMFAPDLAHGVTVSELDLAIITEPSDSPHLTRVQIATEPLCVIMPSDHSAAAKQSVSMSNFGGLGWMIFARKAHPLIYDRLMDEARLANVIPVEVHHYLSPEESVRLVGENFGVAFVAKGIAEQLRLQGMVVRPLSNPLLQISSYLVLRADQSSRLVNEFGRAFLKKVLHNNKHEAISGQLLLRL